MPGYGYSKMSKKEQDKVGKFIEEYLFTRKGISLIVLLIDIRHKPSNNDKIMYDYIINSGLPFIILATKADKIAVTKVDSYVDDLRKNLCVPDDITILPFSSQRKIYCDNVWTEFEKIL